MRAFIHPAPGVMWHRRAKHTGMRHRRAKRSEAGIENSPVVLGVVGGVVHDVVGQDHRGEDGVAADEAGAECMRGGSRVR
jgi:hypothetical protein